MINISNNDTITNLAKISCTRVMMNLITFMMNFCYAYKLGSRAVVGGLTTPYLRNLPDMTKHRTLLPYVIM